MGKQSRRDKTNRKNIIIRNRVFVVLLIIMLIPLLFKGTKVLRNGGKVLDSNVSYKDDKAKGSEQKPQKKNIWDKKEKPAEPEIVNLKILSVGDIMFHMPQIKAAYIGDGKYDFRDAFANVKEHISSADIAIANFETVTAGNDKTFSGFPQFNSPKESLFALKDTGFDILSTANNHCLDGGKDGILNTLKTIEEYGLKSAGTYKDENKELLIEEKNGVKLGFLSYTYGLNGLNAYLSEEELNYMINLIDEEKIKADIEKIKKEADIVAVSIHWGEEYQREPNEFQVNLGHKMVDGGANIVFGSHPHVLQKSEIINKDGKDSFIIYSMGNFFSNQRKDTMGNSYTEDGVMVEIDVEKNITNNETTIKNIEFLPTWVDKYNEAGKDRYRIIPTKDVIDGKLEINFSESIKNRIKKSQEDSLQTLNYK